MVFLEFHRIGTKPILEAVPLLHVLLQVEGKGGGFVPLEEIPEDLQAGSDIQFPSYGGKLGKVGNEVGAYRRKNSMAVIRRAAATCSLVHSAGHADHTGWVEGAHNREQTPPAC